MNIHMIFLLLVLMPVSFFGIEKAQEPTLCENQDCYADYCLNFNEGGVIAHLGRWATPEFEKSQDACAEGCDFVNIEPYSSN
ncbi:MAG: hypothetical protein FH748_02305 [Balneolaceae bacterium]|nr:hypothetical protein [Balneolaceae bacterium]